MTPMNLGERFTLAADSLRFRASRATSFLTHTRTALDSRKVVDQAIGLLMHEYSLTEDAALQALRRRATKADAQLHEVAAKMVREADRSGQPLPPAADC